MAEDRTPRVGIVVASRDDLPVLERASSELERLGVPHTLDVRSAQHDPSGLAEWAVGAADAGYRVLIAGDAGAAQLPGVVAAYTTLPVIGVPCRTAQLGGADALHAIVQMPEGFPVATVGVDAAVNAALLAVQILSLDDAALAERYAEARAERARSATEHREVLTGRATEGFGFGVGSA
ncbi:MAG: hypothetical protein RLZZ272_794 [Actinomycetota bacterium]|jgi:5-(carboxyamino)imidazole ribonucleotide mutase